MSQATAIKLFDNHKVRTLWNAEEEKWYFSIVDVVEVLTGSPNSRKYWSVLKLRLKEEGSQLATNCSQLKMQSNDGKFYLTDVGDTEQILRLVQSIPSKNAESFKLWLAKVGNERIDEMHDPEKAIDRALRTYLRKGYSKEWINQRLKTIEVRKELTDEWERVGIKQQSEFAILTNEITNAWSGFNVKEYKQFKDLKKEISQSENPTEFHKSKEIAKRGGTVARDARQSLEKQTGKSVITPNNNIIKKKNVLQ